MRLSDRFLIVGLILLLIGCILLTQVTEKRALVLVYPAGDYDIYSWTLIPATIFTTTGIVSIIYGYLVKRAYD